MDKEKLPVKGQFFCVMIINKIISTIFLIYRTQLEIYQRFFLYIDVSTWNIDLPTKTDKKIIPILLLACKCEIAQDFILYVAKVV